MRDLLDLGRQLGAAKPLAELLNLVVVAALAELLFDRLHLLAQDVLALRFAHLLLDHRGDFLLHAEHLELAPDHGEDEPDARLHVERLQDLLLVGDGRLRLREVRGDEIGEGARLANVVEDARGVARKVRHEAEHLARRLAQTRAERVELDVATRDSGMRVDSRAHVRLEGPGADDPETAEPVQHDASSCSGPSRMTFTTRATVPTL